MEMLNVQELVHIYHINVVILYFCRKYFSFKKETCWETVSRTHITSDHGFLQGCKCWRLFAMSLNGRYYIEQ